LTANVDIINANLVVRRDQTIAVDTALVANVNAINASLNAANAEIISVNNRLNSVNTARNIALTANLALKADLASPAFSGVPTAPTAAFGANTLQLATTNYVMIRSEFWGGSRKFVSTAEPNNSLGDNGDFWFKYIP
jgi:hypothetical protein